MKLLELHLLQSFPVTCLNRDDVGSPKSAYFGGTQRARVSSQCWKRAIRKLASEIAPEHFAGQRGLYHSLKLADQLKKVGINPELAQKLAEESLNALTGGGKKAGQTSVALYLSPLEIQGIADLIQKGLAAADGKNADAKLVAKAIKDAPRRDFADIAIFGRMVADDHSLMLEGAGMFSHALSTHEVGNEVDFFSAVDDTKEGEDMGAGHIGTLEMNSACYYRYIGLNLDLLFDADHLKSFPSEMRRSALNVFLKACLEAVPGARHNSMFGYTLPDYALGMVRQGQPLSLVNAFERPVGSGPKGYVAPSCEEITKHLESLKKNYGVTSKTELQISETCPINQWIDSLVTSALED